MLEPIPSFWDKINLAEAGGLLLAIGTPVVGAFTWVVRLGGRVSNLEQSQAEHHTDLHRIEEKLDQLMQFMMKK